MYGPIAMYNEKPQGHGSAFPHDLNRECLCDTDQLLGSTGLLTRLQVAFLLVPCSWSPLRTQQESNRLCTSAPYIDARRPDLGCLARISVDL